MKRNPYITILVLALAAIPFGARAQDSRQSMVMQRGAWVMPFDQNRVTHMFLPSITGGVVEIVVRDMDQTQISVVRSHLLQEAARFARGDYSDPAYIHGKSMPGLARLEFRATRVSVRYFETPTGAAITFMSPDPSMVSAIHQWLAAQRRDHSSNKSDHCAMKM